jgi:predicted nucleic acid-binding Zn ribbon protein
MPIYEYHCDDCDGDCMAIGGWVHQQTAVCLDRRLSILIYC